MAAWDAVPGMTPMGTLGRLMMEVMLPELSSYAAECFAEDGRGIVLIDGNEMSYALQAVLEEAAQLWPDERAAVDCATAVRTYDPEREVVVLIKRAEEGAFDNLELIVARRANGAALIEEA